MYDSNEELRRELKEWTECMDQSRSWLSRHVSPFPSTPKEAKEYLKKTRRNNLIILAAVIAVAAVAIMCSIFA